MGKDHLYTLAKVQAPHTATRLCSCHPPSRLSAFITGRPLTQDNFFPIEVSSAPTPAPACCLSYSFPLPPPWDLIPCHRVFLCARGQTLPLGHWLGRGRQPVGQEGEQRLSCHQLPEVSGAHVKGLPRGCMLYVPWDSCAQGSKLALHCKLF